MNIKSYYVNTTSSSINNNGSITTGLSSEQIINKQIQIYPKTGSVSTTNNTVIRTIQLMNNSTDTITIQLYRTDQSTNTYYKITKSLDAKQYAVVFSGYSVFNAGHQFFIKSDHANFSVNISLIEL